MSGNSIAVSPEHRMPVPLVYNLGEHSLIIASDYGNPDAFELAAPTLDEEESSPKTLILDPEETYNLYQCLHTLLFAPQQGESAQ